MKTIIPKNSIRLKLSVVFVLIVSVLQLIFWIFSANVLESVMVYGTQMEIKSIAEDYIKAEKDNQVLSDAEKEDLIQDLSYSWDRNITLVDFKSGAVISTSFNKRPPDGPAMRNNIFTEIAHKYEAIPLGSVKTTIRKDRDGFDQMAIFIEIGRAHV